MNMLSFTELIKIIWWLLLASTTGTTTINPDEVAKLPQIIDESSGLIFIDEILWSLNDSGGRTTIYGFNKKGKFTDSISIANATNIDWEAMAFDRKSNTFFIGDFGNNENKRKNLKIYIFPYIKKGTATPEVIEFKYPDQHEFPASANFDMEGFIFYRDSLYLFSKNKLKWGSGYSKMYSLPAKAGNYTANLIDSFYTGAPITGAAINESGSQIVLMSYGKLFVLKDFEAPAFTKGKIIPVYIPFSQTEAVDFVRADEIYFTNEQRKLFYVDLKRHIKNHSFFLFELWKNL